MVLLLCITAVLTTASSSASAEIRYRIVDVPAGGHADRNIALSPYPETIDDVLEFYEKAVARGTLQGVGKPADAHARIYLIREMLEDAKKFVERNKLSAARLILQYVYKRCDGSPTPPDFLKGVESKKLSVLVRELVSTLQVASRR